MSLYCITNDMPEVRSCTVKDEHQIVCDGFEYRWSDKRSRLETTGRLCHGCLPREARHGLLCWTCWEAADTALAGVLTLQQRLAGIDRAVQRDNGGVRGTSLGYIPIASVPLMLDELASYLRGAHINPDVWVASPSGAKNAVRLGKAFAAAVKAHPTEEQSHRIKRTRCPECRQLALQWNPPGRGGAPVTVTCQNAACGHIFDQTAFDKIAGIEKPCCRQCASETCNDPGCDCHIPYADLIADPRGGLVDERGDFAEPFDPERPEHAALIEEAA